MPATVATMSLIRIGTPVNGPSGRVPRAAERAASNIGMITAPSSALSRSIRSIAASTSSAGVARPVRTSSACAVASSRARSSIRGDITLRSALSGGMDDGALAGRTALVTGGGRGIGAACARSLAAAGAEVVVAGRTVGDLDAIARELDAIAVRVDLTDRADTDRMLAEVAAKAGRIDILVNNAGIAESAPLEATDDAMWDR